MRKIRLKRNPHCQPGLHGADEVAELKKVALPKLYQVGASVNPEYLRLLAVLLAKQAAQDWEPGFLAGGKLALYSVTPPSNYNQELSDLVLSFQAHKGLSQDGKVGRNTWSALGAEEDGWILPASDSSAGSSSSSTSNGDTDELPDTDVSLYERPWFYPVVGVGSLALLVIFLRAMKKRKKSKSKRKALNPFAY